MKSFHCLFQIGICFSLIRKARIAHAKDDLIVILSEAHLCGPVGQLAAPLWSYYRKQAGLAARTRSNSRFNVGPRVRQLNAPETFARIRHADEDGIGRWVDVACPVDRVVVRTHDE